MKQPRQFFPIVVVAVLAVTLVVTQTAFAQDPTQQAMQASQAATRAAAQANANALAASQAATVQANGAAISGQSVGGYIQPPPPAMLNPNSPVPAQIGSAHTVFLANLGADANFPVDATRTYNDISAALQGWGHYQIVDTPAQADLVFQIHAINPITGVGGYGRTGVYSVNTPSLEINILDAKTNVLLWTVDSPLYAAVRASKRESWYNVAVGNLISRVKVLAKQPLTPTETANLTLYPNYHRTRNTLIVVGSVVGLGVAAGLIAHHEYENSLNNQKASQDAFCKANNIPLSECAGG